MKHFSVAIFSLVVASALSGCGIDSSASSPPGGEGTTLSGKLVLTGSSTVAPLAVEIGKRFEAQHPEVRVDVQTGGSSRGIADAQSGIAHIGMASRSLKPDELASGLLSQRIAVDGICLIVHADNPSDTLTNEQVVSIFTGKINNWKEVGGADTEIVVVNKAEGRATLEVFLKYFQLDNSQIAADVIGGENQQVIQTVAGNPAAIGYVSIGEAEAEHAAGTPIKLLAAGGIAPTRKNVAADSFPITRPLNLVTNGEATGLAEAFISFAQSEEVHDLVKQQGFVPLGG
jgi:phosphate transport system substrate-binding protein